MKAAGLTLLLAGLAAGPALAGDDAEAKGIAYLVDQVPRWSTGHGCYSCHNNGDGARALHAAARLGRGVPPGATLDTDRWLSRPEAWDRNGGEGPFGDKTLARLQFASALASGLESGRIVDRGPLAVAADRLAGDQGPDGSWKVDEPGRVGSPATYGRALATWMAREVLRSADPSGYRERIGRADAWLRGIPVETVLDASTVLLAGAFDGPAAGLDRRAKALDLLRKGRSPEGGWGPFAVSPPEAFDTALALLALDRHRDQADVPAMILRGRAYLAESQEDDGSWPETTRPSGGVSYAQRVSTSAWATLALLTVRAP